MICVLFTLRVSLLESNHNATLANSVLIISIALSISALSHLLLCHQEKVQRSSSQYR